MREMIMREIVIIEMVMIGASGFYVRQIRMGHEMDSETGSIIIKEFAERLAIKVKQTE